MRRFAFLGFLLTLIIGSWLTAPDVSAEDESQVVFRGDYMWNVDGHRNELEAVFTPTGDGLWKVEFHFKYARREGIYEGNAQGSLESGDIYGEVKDGAGVVRYRFEAKVQGDRMKGKHFNIWSGRKKETGTLDLGRVNGASAGSSEVV